jgi:hypothetical protein
LSDRNAQQHHQQQRKKIHRRVQQTEAVDFFNVLTGPELLEKTEAYLPAHRERLYPPTVTLSMFMKQALSPDRSCQRAVNAWAAQRTAEGLSVQSIRTGAYCRARQRLPLEMVTALARESGRLLSTQAPQGWLWRGRVVKLADGTGISMPDTPENQARYPQPRTQAKGVGFPLARLVAVICLSTGAVLEAAMGPHEGKGNSELDLFRSLLDTLHAGDVLLADAFYCNYFMIARLQAAGVDVLFEQHGSRITDFRRGTALAKRDHIVRWPRPKAYKRPRWMTREQHAALPEQIILREVKVNGQVLVTTMLNHRQVRKGELSQLYGMRWNVELDLRNIKTTLEMEVLSCLSPQMVQVELWVYLLAYNVTRFLMAQAAHTAGMHPRAVSFKHTVQMWTEWLSRSLVGRHLGTKPDLLRLIAQLKVGNRPGRQEPRARKRRPKPYQWLKVPRNKARRQIRLHGYLPNPSA